MDHLQIDCGVENPGEGESLFSIDWEKEVYVEKFLYRGREIQVRVNEPLHDFSFDRAISFLEKTISKIFQYLMRNIPLNNMTKFSFNSAHIKSAGQLTFRPARRLTINNLWDLIYRVVQSNEQFRVDNSFVVTVKHVEDRRGARRSKSMNTYNVNKTSRLLINNNDNLCLPRALVVALAHAERGPIRVGALHDKYNSIRHPNRPLQRQLALQLVNDAGVIVPADGCGMTEIIKFQKYFVGKRVAILVHDFEEFGIGRNPVYYNGSHEITDTGETVLHNLNLLYNNVTNHYDVILNLKGLACKNFFAYRAM